MVNSWDPVSSLAPGAQEPAQSEGEDSEGSRGESRCTFHGGVGTELRGLMNGCEENIWENIYPEENFPNVLYVAEWYDKPKYDPPEEGDNLLVDLSSIPQVVTPDLSLVTRDVCSGLKAEKHVANLNAMASDIWDRLAGAPRSSMQKREMGGKSLRGHRHGSETSHQVRVEEQGVNTTQTSDWAFFSTRLSEEEWQVGPFGQSCFGSWPEGPHRFICEQRLKKDRWQRRACPDGREGLVELISVSEGTSGPGNSPGLLIEEKLRTDGERLLSSAEKADKFIATNILRSHLPALDCPRKASASAKSKRRQRRPFSLTPNFDLWGQANNVKEWEEGVLVIESHGLKVSLGAEKDGIAEVSHEKEKNKITTFSHHPLWFYFDIIRHPPLAAGGQFSSHCLSFSRLRYSVLFYKNPVPSLGLLYTSYFWKVPLPSRKVFLTSSSQTRVDDKPDDVGLTSSESLGHQSDTSHLHSLDGRVCEKVKRGEEPKSFQCLQTEDNHDSTRTDFDPPGLPLSQEFAFQLVKLFGSPGVPMESLLPEDYVVPLDWKTLKMVYVQWKMSLEKRRKKLA